MLTFLGTWFGYVGMCMMAPDATCRPLLAFLALGIAAAVALTLFLMAYKAAQTRESEQIETERTQERALRSRARIEAAVMNKSIPVPHVGHGHGRWHVAV
jgi:hypothetical protein